MRTLAERTPPAWAVEALRNPALLLLDHLQCEMKAASTALSLISKNPNVPGLVEPMVSVAKEELSHYAMIHALVQRRGYRPEPITVSPYMSEMLRRASIGPHRPFLDRLLLSALVEARSCERFRLLCEASEDAELRELFDGLVASEAGHFNLYQELAEKNFPAKEVDKRFAALSKMESELLAELLPGPQLHSGWRGLTENHPRGDFSSVRMS